MFCPSCGQEQVTEDTRFCSRCGLMLAAISDVMHNNGLLPQNLLPSDAKGKWFRKRGFKQGLFIFFLSFIVVAIITIITLAVDAEPYAVVISAILIGGGGLLRMLYSLLFEADEPNQTVSEQESVKYFGKTKSANALPPQQSIPTSSYIPPKHGNWRDTNDLAQPSVTEGTTKLLEREE